MPHQQCRAVDAAPSVNLQCIINTRQPSQHISSMDHITQELFCSCHFRGFKESRTHRMEKSIPTALKHHPERPQLTLLHSLCAPHFCCYTKQDTALSWTTLSCTRYYHKPPLPHSNVTQALKVLPDIISLCALVQHKRMLSKSRSHTLQRYRRIKEGLGG